MAKIKRAVEGGGLWLPERLRSRLGSPSILGMSPRGVGRRQCCACKPEPGTMCQPGEVGLGCYADVPCIGGGDIVVTFGGVTIGNCVGGSFDDWNDSFTLSNVSAGTICQWLLVDIMTDGCDFEVGVCTTSKGNINVQVGCGGGPPGVCQIALQAVPVFSLWALDLPFGDIVEAQEYSLELDTADNCIDFSSATCTVDFGGP